MRVDDEGQLWRLPAVSVSQQKAEDQRYRRSAGGAASGLGGHGGPELRMRALI